MERRQTVQRRETTPISAGCVHTARLEVAGFAVSAITFPPALYLDPHTHASPCVSVLLAGSLEERQGPRHYALEVGSLLSKPAGEPHDDLFHGAGAEVLVIEPLEPPRLGDGVRLLERPTSFRDYGLAAIAWRIRAELERPDALTPLAVEGQVLELLARGARCGEPGPASPPPPWLDRAREVIHEGFAGALRVTEIAAAIEVHPDHLARVFRRHLGVSIPTYIRRLRLERVIFELASTDTPLKEIAHAVGFCDQSHLSRSFKAWTGVTPQRYRLAMRRRKTRCPGWQAPRLDQNQPL